jgi:hypothetical protein
MTDKGKAAQNIRDMLATTAQHPEAQAGIRRGVLEWLMRKAAPQGVAGKEAGDTGTSLIRARPFAIPLPTTAKRSLGP